MTPEIENIQSTLEKVKNETSKVIIGQEHVINMALLTILTGSHALIEGVPGVAKTLLVRTLGKVLGCESGRIQFTPDLMPTDITGTNVFNVKEQEFVLQKGPVFTTFLLADEINRAPAKTQSALLQSMQERIVSIDRSTYSLNPFFTVFATQNPIEYEGTYPLPEAQKDRFAIKINMTYPEREHEIALSQSMLGGKSPESLLDADDVQAVVSMDELGQLRDSLSEITVKEELVNYMVDLIRATRKSESVLVGAGPRASQSLILCSRAHAVLEGRNFVTPDDVKTMLLPVLEHRLVLRPEYEIEGLSVHEVIESLLQSVAVPR